MGRKNRNAFTILELLIVVTIISALIAVLLPALQAARDAARTIVCASNMRQVQLGLFNYANDHDGFLPPARIHHTTAPHWGTWWGGFIAARDHYVTSAQVFWCPAHSLSAIKNPPSLQDKDDPFAYLMQHPGHGRWGRTGISANFYGAMPWNNWWKCSPLRISAPGVPTSELLVLTEAYRTTQTVPVGYYMVIPGNNTDYNMFTHGDSINASFLDGHVETMQASELLWDTGSNDWAWSTWPPPHRDEAPWFFQVFTKN